MPDRSPRIYVKRVVMNVKRTLSILAAISAIALTGCSHDSGTSPNAPLPPSMASSAKANTAPGGGPPPGVMQQKPSN